MPANLTPQYFEAEKRYRAATTPQEKVEALEEMLAVMPKHKGTDKLRAELRTRIAKFSAEAQRRPLVGKKGSQMYRVVREGAAQVMLVGPTNSGKSELVAALTDTSPAVAAYPFTTQLPGPAMMKFENIQVQLVDMPAIDAPQVHAWLGSTLRSADLLMIVLDLTSDPVEQFENIRQRLLHFRIQVGEGPDETDFRVVRRKALVVGNKLDIEGSEGNCRKLGTSLQGLPVICVSALGGERIEEVPGRLYDTLEVIRVYTKAPGQKADLGEPVVMPKGSTIEDVAETVHKDFVRKLKYAQVWGSGKFEGQRVKRTYVVQEGDVVELHA